MILHCIKIGRRITIPIIVVFALLPGAGQVCAGSPQPEENSTEPILSNVAVNGYILYSGKFFSNLLNFLDINVRFQLCSLRNNIKYGS